MYFTRNYHMIGMFYTFNYHMIGMYFTIKHCIRVPYNVFNTMLAGLLLENCGLNACKRMLTVCILFEYAISCGWTRCEGKGGIHLFHRRQHESRRKCQRLPPHQCRGAELEQRVGYDRGLRCPNLGAQVIIETRN